MSQDDETRRELTEVEQLIDSMRGGPGPDGDETHDGADAGSELTGNAENEAVHASLEAKRDRLRAQLDD
jgi:hypothetical protein